MGLLSANESFTYYKIIFDHFISRTQDRDVPLGIKGEKFALIVSYIMGVFQVQMGRLILWFFIIFSRISNTYSNLVQYKHVWLMVKRMRMVQSIPLNIS